MLNRMNRLLNAKLRAPSEVPQQNPIGLHQSHVLEDLVSLHPTEHIKKSAHE